jgi:hypothetical protein
MGSLHVTGNEQVSSVFFSSGANGELLSGRGTGSSGVVSLLASQHPAFGSFLIETPRIFRQIGTPFGRFFIHLKHLHFS